MVCGRCFDDMIRFKIGWTDNRLILLSIIYWIDVYE